jgi:hypothetical protein
MPSSEIGNTDLLMIDPARAGEVTVEAVRRALIAASPEIGRLDLVLLRNQPARWQGVANPLLASRTRKHRIPSICRKAGRAPSGFRPSACATCSADGAGSRNCWVRSFLRRATTTAEIERYHAAFLVAARRAVPPAGASATSLPKIGSALSSARASRHRSIRSVRRWRCTL